MDIPQPNDEVGQELLLFEEEEETTPIPNAEVTTTTAATPIPTTPEPETPVGKLEQSLGRLVKTQAALEVFYNKVIETKRFFSPDEIKAVQDKKNETATKIRGIRDRLSLLTSQQKELHRIYSTRHAVLDAAAHDIYDDVPELFEFFAVRQATLHTRNVKAAEKLIQSAEAILAPREPAPKKEKKQRKASRAN